MLTDGERAWLLRAEALRPVLRALQAEREQGADTAITLRLVPADEAARRAFWQRVEQKPAARKGERDDSDWPRLVAHQGRRR